MAVPEEIRRVERPKNTIVVDRGGKGPRRYAVVTRIGCKRVGTRNVPVNGPTIGHIIEGRYVPKQTSEPTTGTLQTAPVAPRRPDVLSWAVPKVVLEADEDLIDELLAVLDPADALTIFAIACLRVARPDICYAQLKDAYERSWLAVALPGAQLSKSRVSQLIEGIGRARSLVTAFMRERVARVAEDHLVAISCVHVCDDAGPGVLSRLSTRARPAGARDISVLYALDVDDGEPICGMACSGNVVNSSSFTDFFAACGLRAGLLLGDPALVHDDIEEVFDTCPDLRRLTPLRRDDGRTAEFATRGWEDLPEVADRDVRYVKARLDNGGFLYAFSEGSGKDETGSEKSRSCDECLVTAAFESGLDMDPLTVWRAYEGSRQASLVLGHYGLALELDDNGVRSEDSVVGSEFVNFVATVICCRLIRRFDEVGLLDEYAFGSIMDDLRTVEVVRMADGGDWVLVRMTKRVEGMVRRLGLELSNP